MDITTEDTSLAPFFLQINLPENTICIADRRSENTYFEGDDSRRFRSALRMRIATLNSRFGLDMVGV